MPTETLSRSQARKLILLSQGIHKEADLGSGKNAALRAIEKLAYVQIDTISVVERAHHHTLWNRVRNYKRRHLEKLISEKQVFEYWSHAAAYLPMRDYRYSLPRKQAIAAGERHWYQSDPVLNKRVLAQITEQGAMQAKDFQQSEKKVEGGWGETKPEKRALEQLFIQGELMIAERQGFQKVYDLTERVLPNWVDSRPPSADQFNRHLIYTVLSANGLAKPSEIAYLRKGLKAPIARTCLEMLAEKSLVRLSVAGHHYYALNDYADRLKPSLSRSKVKILSPFDNLLIQRKRALTLFDFDYQIECYVPAKKRKFGYFVLPILWGREFAGRVDAKFDRKSGVLSLLNLYLETAKHQNFIEAFEPSLREFLNFHRGVKVQVKNISSSHHLTAQARHSIKDKLQRITAPGQI